MPIRDPRIRKRNVRLVAFTGTGGEALVALRSVPIPEVVHALLPYHRYKQPMLTLAWCMSERNIKQGFNTDTSKHGLLTGDITKVTCRVCLGICLRWEREQERPIPGSFITKDYVL